MRVVVQRVKNASVYVDGEAVVCIGYGMLALVGFAREDTLVDMEYVLTKVLELRIHNDEKGVMNRSLIESGGELLLVSQFTLYGDTRKGKRPSYSGAMSAEQAVEMYHKFVDMCKTRYERTKSGIFGAHMEIEMINTGPVTLLIDSNR